MNKEKPISEIEAGLYDVLASKELSFGCKILHSGEGELMFIEEKFCQKKEHDSEYGCNNSDYCNNLACLRVKDRKVIFGNNWTPYKIIGHEPTLNDVLLKIAGLSFKCDVRAYSNGHTMIEYPGGGKWVDSGLDYDLQKSFDNQTEETKRKLHKLICVK